MARMPQADMEVDQDEHSASTVERVQQLETQMRDLQTQQASLTNAVQESAAEQASQLTQFKQQVHSQHTQLEQAIKSQSVQMHSFQESFQDQFAQQVAHQQQMLDGMFGRQMAQFEALIQKQNRE